VKLLRFALGLVVATVLHTLGPYLTAQFPAAFDLFLVLAVWTSLSSSASWSAVGGSAAGLFRDALSGGLYGLHGFADTLVAFASARVQQRLLVQQPLQIGLLFAAAAAVQLAIVAGLQILLLPGSEMPGLGAGAARMASCGVLGVILSVSSAWLHKTLDRRRERRRRRLGMSI
jgi:rod shape-determining protein MreD